MQKLVTTKVWSLLAPAERRSAIILMFLMFVGMMLEMLGIGLVVPAIALLSQGEANLNNSTFKEMLNYLGNPSQENLIFLGILSLVSIYIIKTIFLAFLAWRQTHFAFSFQLQVSQQLFSNYLSQPYTFHLQRNSAQLIQNVVNEVSLCANRVLVPLILLVTESMVLIGIGALLLFFEPIGAMIVIIVLGSAAWIFHRITRSRITRWGKLRLLHEGLRLQHLQQGLGGAKEVKLLGRESEFLSQFQQHNLQTAQVGKYQDTLQQLPRLWLELLAVIGLAILVLSMLSQDRNMSTIMPILGLFAAAAFRLMPSVNRVLGAFQSIRYGVAVVDTLHNELMLNAAEEIIVNEPASLFQSELCLKDIHFTYPSTKTETLKGISISIKLGESIGFIGPSGSGKSTLIDIILGLLKPDVGKVLVDGKDVNENLRAWQNQIGYVPQSIYLTDDTLRRNIAFGLPNEEIDDVAVLKAIKSSQLDMFVDDLSNGIETIVGEHGVRLSGGQRQRIGIARALYHDPAILVLDEATSALDETTEREVMQSVDILHGKKTILLIAHRLTTVEKCDRLYQLHKGEILEVGTPEFLLSKKDINFS